MSLPALLSENGGHAGRMLGITPFIAYLCALLIMEIRVKWKSLGPAKGPAKFWGTVGMAGLLGAAALINFQDYFGSQIRDPAYLNDFSWPETKVGQAIAGDDGKTEFFLPSRYFGHPTVNYLAGPALKRTHQLDLANPPRPGLFPRGEAFCFLLDEFKMGTLNFLQSAYPGGETSVFHNLLGETPLYVYQVSAPVLAKIASGYPLIQRGLRGSYYPSQGTNGRPFLDRWDPVINFTFRDLLFAQPSFIRWQGHLLIPLNGLYDFLVVTYQSGQATLKIDDQSVENFSLESPSQLKLKKGWHDLQLTFREGAGPIDSINLLWKKPGQEKYEFIPNENFGKRK